MRVLCLVDGRVDPPDRWIWNYLSAHAQRDSIDFMYAVTRDLFPKWGKLLSYYPAYWKLAVRALRQSRKVDYDVIVAWESKNGFPLAVLRSLLGVRKPKLVILAFVYKGIVMHFRSLGRLAMRGVDHITVPTMSEVEHYNKLLGFPLDKTTFSPLGCYDMASAVNVSEKRTDSYIFAGGRSGRDYRTLFKAALDIDAQFVVNARKFNVQGLDCPLNVRLHDFMPMHEYYALMAGSQFVVVPLKDTSYAVGLGHIIQAMSAGKALIATRTAGTVDYLEDGQTGVLVPPYDTLNMRSAITYLLDHPGEVEAMGQKARQRYEEMYTFTAFSERIYGVLQKVAVSGQHG